MEFNNLLNNLLGLDLIRLKFKLERNLELVVTIQIDWKELMNQLNMEAKLKNNISNVQGIEVKTLRNKKADLEINKKSLKK